VPKFVLALASLLAVGLPPLARAQDEPRYEFHAGYAYLRDLGEGGSDLPVGWSASFAWNFTPSLGAVIDVGGNYKTEAGVDLSQHAFLGGVRYSFRGESLTPYVEALAGATRASASALGVSDSATDFAAQAGVGLAFRVSDRLSARVGADFRNIFSEGESFQQFRAIAGIQFGWGGESRSGGERPRPTAFREPPPPYQEPPRPAPVVPEPAPSEPAIVQPRPAPAPAADALGRGRGLLLSGDYAQAAAAFREHLRQRAYFQYTVAVGLFCDPSNVAQMVAGAGDGELMLLTVARQGRTCYGVYWGLYGSRAEAVQALGSLPASLRAPGQTAVEVSRILR
jgi:opacity protein-like surface antigen